MAGGAANKGAAAGAQAVQARGAPLCPAPVLLPDTWLWSLASLASMLSSRPALHPRWAGDAAHAAGGPAW